MARPRHGGYGLRSTVVAWLRVILPLAALALLSTLFLLSRRPDPEAAIPYARVDAEALAREPRITAPEWAGMTPDGAKVTLRGATATSGGDGGRLEAMRLDWTGPDGTTAHATAPEASLEDGALLLGGGVAIRLSSGWTLDAQTLSASRGAADVTASGNVRATAPFGDITAEQAQLHRPEPGAEVLDFTGGVRLIYQP